MRISTPQIQQQGINTILDQQAQLNKTQLQVSTGRRVLSPQDDPAAANRILELSQALAVINQYQSNSDAAKARLSLEESTLAGVVNLLQEVRSRAVQANVSTLSAVDRAAIATEVRQRLGELLSLANTQDGNGEYLFAGYKGQTQPFAANTSGGFDYNGDSGQRFLQVSAVRQVAVSDSGAEIFQAIRNGNGTFTTADNAANTGSGIIDTGTVNGAFTSDTYTVILGHSTTVTGGAINLNDTGVNDTLQYQLRINGTLVYTGAEGSSRTQAQLAADINAQSGVTNVGAYVSGGVLYLANTTPNGAAITVTETLTGASEDTDTVTGYFGSALTGITTPSRTISYNAAATGYVVLNSAGAVQTAGAYQSGAAINFNGVQTSVSGAPNNGDRFTISPSANQDVFSSVQNLAKALEPGGGTAAHVNNVINRTLLDIDQALNNIVGAQAKVGARLNAVDSQKDLNDTFALQTKETLSNVQDLDFAEAASRLNLQLTALQAAQQAFIRVQGLSLFNFLK
ncbi:MAG: flagellar hook-associated protein FlgL [Pseudomonadota bacterium]